MPLVNAIYSDPLPFTAPCAVHCGSARVRYGPDMATPYPGNELQSVMANEVRLLDPTVRRSPTAVDDLLHPEFVEFGASGRVWDRASMTAEIGEAHLTAREAPTVAEPRGARLAEGVIQVTYVTQSPGRRARRSSLWLRCNEWAWRLYFHQGTPARPT